MAYQARRARQQIETFELVNDEGAVVNRYDVHLGMDGLGKRLSEKYIALNRTLDACRRMDAQAKNGSIQPENMSEMLETLGLAVTDILCTVFGEDEAREIIEFYDGNYGEMCQEVMPFVSGVVLPKARALGQEKRKQTMKSYIRR